jgi:dihydropteroate synthase
MMITVESVDTMTTNYRNINLSTDKTMVMGVLNITPDSFSDGGAYIEPLQAMNHALKMIEEGADIIDIGGESSRPGAVPVSSNQEIDRVIPVIQKIREHSNISISVDTTKAKVAYEAVQAGADIVNDISSFHMDTEMRKIVKQLECPVILMHMQETPQTMQNNPVYGNVVEEIKLYLKNVIDKAVSYGIHKEKIIIDPGIGFGKTIEHNLEIIHRLSEFKELGCPLLIGASRKSFIGKILDLPVEDRLEGGLAVAAIAVWNGANIIRTHDVKQTLRLVRMVDSLKGINL